MLTLGNVYSNLHWFGRSLVTAGKQSLGQRSSRKKRACA